MTTRTVTVHIESPETWEDIVGEDPKTPRYVLCCGTILIVGGDLQSNTVDNDPSQNKIDEKAKTISFEWTVPEEEHIHLQADYLPRMEPLTIPDAPSVNARDVNPKAKEVYTVIRDKTEQHDARVEVSKGTKNWVSHIKLSSDFIGIENNFTIQPILWESIDGKAGRSAPVNKYPGDHTKADFWVHGSGTISLIPHNIINIWFQREAASKAFSTVDQSEKGLVDVFHAGNENPAPIEYDENDGWPEAKLDDMVTTNHKPNGTA